MDSGWSAVAGSLVGSIGTLGTTWLGAYLKRKRPSTSEKAAKELLRRALEERWFKWRSIRELANLVGVDEPTVRRLLLVSIRKQVESFESVVIRCGVSESQEPPYVDARKPRSV
jgi:hypothetical protein